MNMPAQADATKVNTAGGYRYIPSVFQYSSGVAAEDGFELVRARFHRPVPLDQGFAAIEAHLMETEGFDKADLAHFREVLNGAIDGAAELRADFAGFIDRRIEQLSPVEHAILLIGSYEMKNRAEIPYRVVINEAVELAKSFGGTEGFKYVNGVLDKLAGKLRPAEAARAGA
jgi:N utilization substance protein B